MLLPIGTQDLGGVIDNSGIDPTKFSQLTQSLRADLNLSTCCRRTGRHRSTALVIHPPRQQGWAAVSGATVAAGKNLPALELDGTQRCRALPMSHPSRRRIIFVLRSSWLSLSSLPFKVYSFQTIDTKCTGVFASYLRWCWRTIS